MSEMRFSDVPGVYPEDGTFSECSDTAPDDAFLVAERDDQIALPELAVLPADEVLQVQEYDWHSLRGFDFAGLDSMLDEGIKPSNQLGKHGVCLSASPAFAAASCKQASSFCTYALKGGISVGVVLGQPKPPMRDYAGGFPDERRVKFVPAESIRSILLSDTDATLPLSQAAQSTTHERRRPLQAAAYVDRTISHLDRIGAPVDDELRAFAAEVTAIHRGGEYGTYAPEDVMTRLEHGLMTSYAGYLQEVCGVAEPTVGDMISAVLLQHEQRAPMPVYGFSEQQKAAIVKQTQDIDVSQARALLYGYIPWGDFADLNDKEYPDPIITSD